MIKNIGELEDKNLEGYHIRRVSHVREKPIEHLEIARSVAVFEDNALANEFAKKKDRYFLQIEFVLTNGQDVFFIHGQKSFRLCTTIEEAEENERKYTQVH